MRFKHTSIMSGIIILVTLLAGFCGMLLMRTETVEATVNNVTIKCGAIDYYSNFHVKNKWITHVNGQAIDLDDEPGVTRSYAYCVEPTRSGPADGTYNVVVIDDSYTGNFADMRKLIYYLPGAYGYTKVTKSRWFNRTVENCSDYAIGHIALSYQYDNYSADSDAWEGTGSEVRAFVDYILEDLKQLPSPPASFEVFWIKFDNAQNSFGALYATEYGKAEIKKLSTNTLISDKNSCYTLKGARYTVYSDSACTKVAKTKAGSDAVLSVKADGSSDAIELETGTYYIKETSAPRGYALDTRVRSLQILKDKTTTYTAYDVPKNNDVGILLQKIDSGNGRNKAQSAATLEGAEFTVKYYDISPTSNMSESELAELIKDREPAIINNRKAVWVFRTDDEGRVDFQDPDRYLVKEKSAELYTDNNGKYVLPIGVVSIEETKAPVGYSLNDKIFYRSIVDAGSVEKLNSFNTLTEGASVKEKVYRADISFSKSEDGEDRLAYIPFRITSLTTGESHIIVTDENGYANTSSGWNRHSNNTNEGRSDMDGIWFSGCAETDGGARVDDSLGAMPYDTYLIEEMPCEANRNYKLISDTVTVKRNSVIIDLGTFDNKPVIRQVPSSDFCKYNRSPKTGDEGRPVLYVLLSIMALIEAAVLTKIKRGGRLKGRSSR